MTSFSSGGDMMPMLAFMVVMIVIVGGYFWSINSTNRQMIEAYRAQTEREDRLACGAKADRKPEGSTD